MEILINNNQDEVRLNQNPFQDLAKFIIKKEKIPDDIEISIAFISTVEMSRLNKKYRKQKGPTDVLSFKYTDNKKLQPGELIGEVVICPAVAENQAKENGIDLMNEIKLLLTHGILHLLGYSHNTEKNKEKMNKLEQETIAEFNSGE